jgi:hypothetical protein
MTPLGKAQLPEHLVKSPEPDSRPAAESPAGKLQLNGIQSSASVEKIAERTYQSVVQIAEFQNVRHRGLMERQIPVDPRAEGVRGSTEPADRFW